MVSGSWICVDCSADRSVAGLVHSKDSVWDRRAAGRLCQRGGGTSGAVPVRSLFRSPGEQSPATVGGLVPFLPVFKTGRAGQPPAWKVRLLRRVVARWRCPRERRGRRPPLELLLVASAPLGDVRTSARLPVGAESGSLAETAAWATERKPRRSGWSSARTRLLARDRLAGGPTCARFPRRGGASALCETLVLEEKRKRPNVAATAMLGLATRAVWARTGEARSGGARRCRQKT